MNRVQKVLSSAIAASIFAIMPFVASAQTLQATGSTGVVISPNGIVRIIGADVTAVSNGAVDAVTRIGNVVMNWVVNVSASTTVVANGSKNATTTDIKVGDKVGFVGSLSSSIGSSLTVAATKIRDLTNFPFPHFGAGTISSINSANGSFVLTGESGRTVTVQTDASTTISLNGATTTFSAFTVGEEVGVAGTLNADGSVITASNIVIKNSADKGEGKNDNDNDGNNDKVHANTSVNVNANANINAGEHSDGSHAGLNFLGGLGLHFGKDN
jgi:hypothetical protein